MYNQLLIKYNSLLYKMNTGNDESIVDNSQIHAPDYQVLRMKSPNNSNYSRSGTRKLVKSTEIMYDGKVQQFNADL